MPQPTSAPTSTSVSEPSACEDLQREPKEREEESVADASRLDAIQRSADDAREEEEMVQAKPAAGPPAAEEQEDTLHRFAAGSTVARRIQRRASPLYRSDVVQRAGRAPPSPGPTFESQLLQAKGNGQPLPRGVCTFMESRFQSDFSGVRVHTGADAESLSKDIHAQAFTHGSDIYFNSGKYDPDSAGGRMLLAHELTHTIQQGASPARSGAVQRAPLATPKLQRQAAVPQLGAAVTRAKAEEGKVNANVPGPDGNRTGWERLLDYFKTAMGPDKIVSSTGGGYVQGTVSEQVIKRKSQALGQVANQPPDVVAMRDAMPSWCGIFVWWALEKGGVPMPKWELGGRQMKPEAVYPPGYTPKTGDIAYRNEKSHYAIVEQTSGAGSNADVITVNGNTAGEDNLGAQVQTRTHKLSNWTAFFNPLVLMQGSLRDAEAMPDAKPKSLKELRKELFRVNRKAEPEQEEPGYHAEDARIQAKHEIASGAPAQGAPNLQRAEEEEREEEPVEELSACLQRSPEPQTGAGGSPVHGTGAVSPGAAGAHSLAVAPAGLAVTAVAAPASQSVVTAQSGAWEQDRGPPQIRVSLQRAEEEEREEEPVEELSACLQRSPEPQTGVGGSPVHGTGAASPGAAGAYSLANAPAGLAVTAVAAPASQSVVTAKPGAWEQDRGPPQVLRASRNFVQCSWLSDAWDAVSGFAGEALEWVEQGLDAAKTWLLEKVRDFVREIPGYKMLSFILAQDPITGEAVERTGRNLLYAGLDLLPTGSLFKAVIERIGVVDDIAAYLDARISDLSALARGVGDSFDRFWDSISIDDFSDPEGVFNRVAELLRSTIDSIVTFVTNAATDFLEMIKRIMLREIVAFIRERVPRLYPLLCVALGRDPITEEEVPRNGTNILNAILEVSEEGQEQRKQMQETGTFAKIAGYIDRGIHVFSTAYVQFRQAFSNLWDYVTIEALFSPVETSTRIYNDFAAPVTLVTDYIVEVALEILRVIKEALMRRLSAWARTVRGYSLVTVIIGRDPFTGAPVPRTMENIIKGFMSLMDGGEEQFNQLKESGAIDRTTARISAAVARLNMTPAGVIALFIDLWNSFSIRDLADPIGAFERILATFGEPIRRLIAFVVEIVKIVVEVVLAVMNFPTDLIANIITKAMQAFEMIKRDPVGFLKNLLRSIKQGFIQFFDNILTHLLNGVVGWLMSELRDAGVPTLSDFSLRGVIAWVLEVLGISMEKIWEKLAAHPRIGPARVARIRSMINTLEGIWTFIKDVQERGMAAIWDKIQEQLSNLWNTVIDAVKNWIMEKIIGAVVTKLLSMLDPTGIMAVINSAIAIYRAVQSFIRYITQMLQVVNSFVEGVVEIAGGNITRAANALEGAMDRAMPVVIGFLANQVGLGGVGRRIGEIIEQVRGMVDEALTWLVNKAVDTGFALLDRVMALGRSAIAALTEWWKGKKEFTGGDAQQHKVYFEGNEASPVLTIRSEPKPYTVFLTGYETQLTPGEAQAKVSTPEGEKTKTEVLARAKEIAGKIEDEKKKGVKGDTDEKTKENEAKKAAEIDRLLGLLAAASGPLFGSQKPLDSEIVLPAGANNHNFAASMKAEKIYKTPFVTSKGSAPTGARHNLFDQVDHRQKGNGSYYIRGHLLNDNLGGPGMWTNMTALSRTGNHQHEEQVESKVKAAFDAGAVINYEVTATGTHNPTMPTPADKPRFTKIANIERDFPVVQSIIGGERQLCQSLVCKAFTMKYEGSSWVPDKQIASATVENRVETDFGSYELGDNVQPPKVNLNTGAVDQLARLASIGEGRAQAIDNYRKSEAEKAPGTTRFFAEIADVAKVPGIGAATVAALKGDTLVEL
jgi:hypothetical protein